MMTERGRLYRTVGLSLALAATVVLSFAVHDIKNRLAKQTTRVAQLRKELSDLKDAVATEAIMTAMEASLYSSEDAKLTGLCKGNGPIELHIIPFQIPQADCNCELPIAVPMCMDEGPAPIPISLVFQARAHHLAELSENKPAQEIVKQVRKALGEDPVCEPLEESPVVSAKQRLEGSL